MNKRASQARGFVVDRPVAVLMVFAAAVVFGFFSFRRLPVTLMPELNYPTITIRTEYPGAAPEEVENEVSRPIEEAVGVVGGLKRLSSISRAGVSDVVMEFLWGTDMNEAIQETLEKLDLVFLPREAERPMILRFDPTEDPIMELSLSGKGLRFQGEAGLRRLRRLADLQVKRALEPIPGVAAARVRGGLEEEFHVLLDEEALTRLGLPVSAVTARLGQENINLAGGTLQEGRAEYMIRTINEFKSLDDIRNTVVAQREGRVIRVRDIARVVRAQKDREMITRTDGRESVMIDVYKEADANIVAVAKAVTRAVGEIADAPGKKRGEGIAQRLYDQEGAALRVVADRSRFIEGSIRDLRQTALYGGLLAVLVLYLFLADFRTTAIIGVSIPLSLVIAFAPLNLLGKTLNIMSLGGLALGVGMLVDNSIVVLESIFRCREEGDDLRSAALRGTREVRGAVTASTLTTVAVFFPLVFVQGIAGQAFGDLATSVVTSLLASLLVAVLFIPMLASRQGAAGEGGAWSWREMLRWRAWEALKEAVPARRGWGALLWPWELVRFAVGSALELMGKLLLALLAGAAALIAGAGRFLGRVAGRALMRPLSRFVRAVLDKVLAVYPGALRAALRRPAAVFLIAAALAAGAGFLAVRLQTELLPEIHQGEFTFEVSLPVGTPIERTAAILTPIEQAILADKREIERLIVTFGYDINNMKRSDEGEHTARFKVILRESSDPQGVEERVLARLRRLFRDIPDTEARVTRPVLFSSEAPIMVEIESDDLALLRRMSRQAQGVMERLPELADVEAALRRGAPEIQIIYDRDRVALYGLNLAQTARQVRDLVRGYEATRFNLRDRRVPVVARLEESERERVEDIERLVVNPGAPQPIPLEAIAMVKAGEGPSEVRRIDGRRVAVITANVAPGASLSAAAEAINRAFQSRVQWPSGVRYTISGQKEEWEESRASLYVALGLSLFLVYAIMASQFESLLQPLIIMLTIPLAFIGSAAGLWALGEQVSIVVFLGLIMLAGIVVNNGIVLIDYTNILRRRGLSLDEAVVAAGRVRLRPILMTTATTVLGLLPMALGLGEGAEIRTPMALTVMFGLLSSTLLTLLVIPTAYHALARWLQAGPAGAEAETSG